MMMIPSSHIDAVRRGTERGRYSLFLGAGFSMTSRSADGRRLPSSGELTKELADAFSLPDGYGLSQLSQTIPESKLASFLSARFLNTKPATKLHLTSSFVWKHIFTLNVDDALAAVYSAPRALQQPVLFTFRDSYRPVEAPVDVPIVHLHGTVSHPDHGYVFTVQQYGKSAANDSTWFKIVADLFVQEPFIVIGCSLSEPDLEYYLARRTGLSTQSHTVAPSLFVTRQLDVVQAATCSRFGLLPVEADAESFLTMLDGLVRPRPTPVELMRPAAMFKVVADASQRSQAIFFRQWLMVGPDNLPQPPEERVPPPLLRGVEPQWIHLLRNDDIPRTAMRETLLSVSGWWSTENRSPRFDVILAAAGTGKSVIAKRLSIELARSGISVFYFVGTERLGVSEAVDVLVALNRPVVLVVDAVADHIRQMVELARRLAESGVHAYFVACDRLQRRAHIQNAALDIAWKAVSLTPLTSDEAHSLVSKLRALGLLGRQVRLTDDALASRLHGADLLAALITVSGDSDHATKIIHSEWMGVSDEGARTVYGVIAIAHALGFPLSMATAARAAGVSAADFRKHFDTELSGMIGWEPRAGYYVITRHRRVAELLLESLPADVMFRLFTALARALAPYVARPTIKRQTFEARLAGRLLDFDGTVNVHLKNDAERFYLDIHDEWSWNSRYWEQRALLELERDPHTALKFAETAVGIERHPLPLTTLGKVQLAMSKNSSRNDDVLYFLKAGVDTLDKAIELSRNMLRRDPLPYDVAMRGVLAVLEKLSTQPIPPVVDNRIRSQIEAFLNASRPMYPAAQHSAFVERWHDVRDACFV